MSLRSLSDKKKESEKHHNKKSEKHLKDDVSFIDFQLDLSLSKEISKKSQPKGEFAKAC